MSDMQGKDHPSEKSAPTKSSETKEDSSLNEVVSGTSLHPVVGVHIDGMLANRSTSSRQEDAENDDRDGLVTSPRIWADEETRMSHLRKRNAMYSKRKYYKKKVEVERLEMSKYELETTNQKLSQDNERLECLLNNAKKIVQMMGESGDRNRDNQIHSMLASHHALGASQAQTRGLPSVSSAGLSVTPHNIANLLSQQNVPSLDYARLRAAMSDRAIGMGMGPNNAAPSSFDVKPNFPSSFLGGSASRPQAPPASDAAIAAATLEMYEKIERAQNELLASRQNEKRLLRFLSSPTSQVGGIGGGAFDSLATSNMIQNIGLQQPHQHPQQPPQHQQQQQHILLRQELQRRPLEEQELRLFQQQQLEHQRQRQLQLLQQHQQHHQLLDPLRTPIQDDFQGSSTRGRSESDAILARLLQNQRHAQQPSPEAAASRAGATDATTLLQFLMNQKEQGK